MGGRYIFLLFFVLLLGVPLISATSRLVEFSRSYDNVTYATSSVQTLDGGYFMVIPSWANYDNLRIMKTDPGGNLIWSKIISFSINGANPTKAIQLSDGSFIVASIFYYIDFPRAKPAMTPAIPIVLCSRILHDAHSHWDSSNNWSGWNYLLWL